MHYCIFLMLDRIHHDRINHYLHLLILPILHDVSINNKKYRLNFIKKKTRITSLSSSVKSASRSISKSSSIKYGSSKRKIFKKIFSIKKKPKYILTW